MKKTELDHRYFFVDESGDPTFYNRYGKCIVGEEGCSKILILGFIRTENPKAIRLALSTLKNEISKDEYLKKIPSLAKSLLAFHAKDDCSEIREKVFKLIKTLDFKAEFIVARKQEVIFRKKHQSKEDKFYHDLTAKLFENKLHRAKKNSIYFAVRGSITRQELLDEAIDVAKKNFERKWATKIDTSILVYPQQPSDEPCLQVVDYMNWVIQRAFVRGEERYYDFIKEKISFLLDVYDNDKYPNNYYNEKNVFAVNKISPL